MTTQTRSRELSRSPVTLEDLTADLIWPRLLRAASLALGPSRLAIAFIAVVLLVLIGRFVGEIEQWRASDEEQTAGLGTLLWTAAYSLLEAISLRESGAIAESLYFAFVTAPAAALDRSPVAAIVAVVLGGLVLIMAGGAISRMAACEFSLGLSVGFKQGLRFALSRIGSLAGAMLGPFVVVWVLALVVAIGGLLLRVPVLNVAGGLLFGVALLLGLLAVLVMVAYTVGQVLLIPAVACESADAIDAIQRAYAYVFGRPIRFAIYAIVLLLQAAVVLFLVRVIALGLVAFATQTAAAMAGDEGGAVIGAIDASETETAAKLGSTAAAAAWLIRLWIIAVGILVAAYTLSFYYCASTLLYLAMRRIADGQDMHELWLPGNIRGTTAEDSNDEGVPPGAAPEGGLIE